MSDTLTKTPIKIEPAAYSRISEVDFSNLQFGRLFGDHMFEMVFENGAWGEPMVKPYGTIEIEPAMNVFHYGQAVFEGMKAFYVDDKTINIFRPDEHHARFNRSCRRMCIPETDYETFISALETLIKLDKNGFRNQLVPPCIFDLSYLPVRIISQLAFLADTAII